MSVLTANSILKHRTNNGNNTHNKYSIKTNCFILLNTNEMKKILHFLVMAMLFFASCGKESENSDGTATTLKSLNGTTWTAVPCVFHRHGELYSFSDDDKLTIVFSDETCTTTREGTDERDDEPYYEKLEYFGHYTFSGIDGLIWYVRSENQYGIGSWADEEWHIELIDNRSLKVYIGWDDDEPEDREWLVLTKQSDF